MTEELRGRSFEPQGNDSGWEARCLGRAPEQPWTSLGTAAWQGGIAGCVHSTQGLTWPPAGVALREGE